MLAEASVLIRLYRSAILIANNTGSTDVVNSFNADDGSLAEMFRWKILFAVVILPGLRLVSS